MHSFVSKFVLCPKCNLPETELVVRTKSQRIMHDCAACGAKSPVDMSHKLCTFILRESASGKKESKKDKKDKKEKKEKKGKKEKDGKKSKKGKKDKKKKDKKSKSDAADADDSSSDEDSDAGLSPAVRNVAVAPASRCRRALTVVVGCAVTVVFVCVSLHVSGGTCCRCGCASV